MSLASLFKKAANAVVKVVKDHPHERDLAIALVATKLVPAKLKPIVSILVGASAFPRLTPGGVESGSQS